MDPLYTGSMFMTGVSSVALAFWAKAKDNPSLTRIWRALLLSIALWSLGRAGLGVATTHGFGLVSVRFSYAASSWMGFLYVLLCGVLVKKELPRAAIWLWGVLCACLSVAAWTSFLIADVTEKLSFRFYDVPGGMVFQLFSAQYTLGIILGVGLLIFGIWKESGIARNRILYVLLASVVGFGASWTTFPLVNNVQMYPFGVPFIALYPVLLTYGVVKHHVMEVNLAFRYGTMWVAYVFVGLVFSLGPFMLFGANPSPEWLFSSLLAVGGGPFIFRFAMPAITSLVDRLPMFRGRYERFGRLEALFSDISSTKTLIEWNDTVKDVAMILCPTENIALLVKDDTGKRFIARASEGFSQAEKIFLNLPMQSLLATYLVKSKNLLLAETALALCTSEERNQMEVDLELMRASICVPILFDGTLYAIIGLGDKPGKEAFNDLELTSLTALARAAEHQLRVILSGLAQEQTTSIWAHDLIKPFTLKGSFQYLEQMLEGSFGPMSAETQQAIKLILNDVGFVKQNLKQVLNPGQGDSYNILSTSLTGVYFRLRENYTIESIKRHFKWSVDVPPTDLRVFCDWSLIEHRVLANLIENAFRYTPTDGTVELGWQIKDGKFIGFVKDNGIGIRENDIPKLFKPRTQLEEGNKGLSGLGLFSAKSVVEAHNGRIWVESTFGKGAAFFFELPLASAPHKHV